MQFRFDVCHLYEINNTKPRFEKQSQSNRFLTNLFKIRYVRTWIIASCLCIFCFFLPLQCFIIGDNLGLGVQGAVFRYQMTVQGNSLIPITRELGYVSSGIYSGKSALSVVLWTLGTIVLAATTILSLVHWNRLPHYILKLILLGLVSAGILYLGSCVAQYGLFLSDPAGISLPIGVVILCLFTIFLYSYQNLFFSTEHE